MTLEDSIHSQRLRVLRDAERLGNVSEACRRHGLSRTLFYRLRRRLELYGPDGLHPSRQGTALAALVVYAGLTGARPAALPVPGDPESAAALREAAAEALARR